MTLKMWTEPARRRTILVRDAGPMSGMRAPPGREATLKQLAFPEVHFAYRESGGTGDYKSGYLYVGLAHSGGGLFIPVIGNHVSDGGRVCLGSAIPESLDSESFAEAFWNSVFHVFDEQVRDFQQWQASGNPDDSLRLDLEVGELGKELLVAYDYAPPDPRVIAAARAARQRIMVQRITDMMVNAGPEAAAVAPELPEVQELPRPPRRRSAMLRPFRDEEPWRVAWRRRRIR